MIMGNIKFSVVDGHVKGMTFFDGKLTAFEGLRRDDGFLDIAQVEVLGKDKVFRKMRGRNAAQRELAARNQIVNDLRGTLR